MSQLIAIFFIAITSVSSLWAFSESLSTEELTIYEAICYGTWKDGICIGKEEPLPRTTFKVMLDQQKVIFWSEDDVPDRMDACAIRNVRNWSCTQASGNISQMVDGEYRLSSHDQNRGEAILQVPKWRWWSLKLRHSGAPEWIAESVGTATSIVFIVAIVGLGMRFAEKLYWHFSRHRPDSGQSREVPTLLMVGIPVLLLLGVGYLAAMISRFGR